MCPCDYTINQSRNKQENKKLEYQAAFPFRLFNWCLTLCNVLSNLNPDDLPTIDSQEATVYWDAARKSVILKEGVVDTEGGAYGYFNDTLLLTGWGILEICAGHGGISQDDETTFFLAGYLEGYLTAG